MAGAVLGPLVQLFNAVNVPVDIIHWHLQVSYPRPFGRSVAPQGETTSQVY